MLKVYIMGATKVKKSHLKLQIHKVLSKMFVLGRVKAYFFVKRIHTYEKSEYDFKMALAPLSTHRGTRV